MACFDTSSFQRVGPMAVVSKLNQMSVWFARRSQRAVAVWVGDQRVTVCHMTWKLPGFYKQDDIRSIT